LHGNAGADHLAGLCDEWENRETGERIKSCSMIITDRTTVNGCLRKSLTLVQIDDALSSHIELSVSRIVRHFVPDPRGKVEFLICVLQRAVAYDPKVVPIWESMRRYFHEEARLPVEVVLFQSYEALPGSNSAPASGVPLRRLKQPSQERITVVG
jgi:hypothetical protein